MSGFITYRGRCCRRGDFNHAIMHGTLSLSLQFKRAQGTVGSLGPLGVLVLPSQRCARNDRPRVAMMPMIGTAHERTILSTVFFSIYVYAYVCASVACFWEQIVPKKRAHWPSSNQSVCRRIDLDCRQAARSFSHECASVAFAALHCW